MFLAPLEQINNLASADKAPNQEALRQAARQFEAILLMQLTSALNGADKSEDEDSLFGGDGGTDMAKKMFSEQLATTMSESGGVGLADMMMQKFGVTPKPAAAGGGSSHTLTKSISAIKAIRSSGPSFREEAAPAFQRPVSQTNLSQMTTDQILQIQPEANSPFMPDYESFRNTDNGKFMTVADSPGAKNSNEVEIISTYEDETRAENVDNALQNPALDGKTLNSTRARIVPNAPVSEDGTPIAAVSNAPAGGKVNYEMPVRGRVSSNFGMRFHPIDKVMKFHAGLDLAVPMGTPVSSAADGIVTFAGRKDGYGNVVIVQHHDGRETRYGHLSKINVAENERVAGGQQIALSGTTGKSTGPHLHFEVRENGEAVNPLKFVPKVLR